MSDQNKPKASATNPAPKKSEGIEIRLPLDSKTAFRDACDTHGETASGVLRQAIDHYTNHGHFKATPPKYRSFTLIVSGMILGGLLVGTAITANTEVAEPENPLLTPYFTNFDANGDGLLTLTEFRTGLDALSEKYSIESRLKTIKGGGIRPSANTDVETVSFAFNKGTGITTPIAEQSSVNLTDIDVEVFSKLNFPVEHLISLLTGESPECETALLQISEAEFAREFYTLDHDKDNLLTLKEFSPTQLLPQMQELREKFDALDVDQNGHLTVTEIQADFKYSKPLLWASTSFSLGTKNLRIPDVCDTAFNGTTLVVGDASAPLSYNATFNLHDWSLSHFPTAHGMNKALYATLDNNQDKELSFDEFVGWFKLAPRVGI